MVGPHCPSLGYHVVKHSKVGVGKYEVLLSFPIILFIRVERGTKVLKVPGRAEGVQLFASCVGGASTAVVKKWVLCIDVS